MIRRRTAGFAVVILSVGTLLGCQITADDPVPTSTSNVVAEMARCLQERGWDVTAGTATGGFDVEVADGQSAAFATDNKECTSQTGFGEAQGERFDAAGAGNYFDELIVVKSCLELGGYDVSNPPSRETFVDDYLSGGSGGWTPYAQDATVSQQQTMECLQPTE